jgi:hypothetical protein
MYFNLSTERRASSPPLPASAGVWRRPPFKRLGICIPEEYGGSGLGILEAGLMMRTIAESGGG